MRGRSYFSGFFVVADWAKLVKVLNALAEAFVIWSNADFAVSIAAWKLSGTL